MFKKPRLVMLTIALSFMTLVGCATESGSEQVETQTEGGSTDNGSDEPVEIEFWYGLGGQLGENVERIISEFNESQDDVIVTGVAQGNYDETEQKLQAAIAAQNVPAAVLLGNGTVNAFGSRGILASIDEFIAADSDLNVDDFVDSFYEQGTVDGVQYALPLYGTTQVMYYRHDIFEELGLTTESLETFEALAEAADRIKEEKGIYGWMPMWGADNLIDFSMSNGAQFLSDDGTEVLIDSPEWIEAWEYIRKAIHEDETMAINHGGEGWAYWYQTIDDVLQDRAAGYTGSSGDQGDLDFSLVSAHPQPGWENHHAAPHAYALLAAIPELASDEEKEAAYQFITFFNSPEKTADWSMSTGYIAVRASAREVDEFQAFAEENPQILVPLEQAETATLPFIDPTGGLI
ncbi:ABC transporter substrate-binding protein [Bacillus sp. JCM 19034]|uniref:ABC transporter substrate-binding protein n=1 Tax=Bacillus sp. JCM 19034 TaxID=1481928 RepID=UPI000ADAFBD5|nr:ABC transporter substrate-binding protein [Bacillus sp. JCM 19034]